MLIVIAFLFLFNFRACPWVMLSFICCLYILANSGFFANFFCNYSNVFKVTSLLKRSWGCSSRQKVPNSKWPFFNDVVVSKMFKERSTSEVDDNGWCWYAVWQNPKIVSNPLTRFRWTVYWKSSIFFLIWWQFLFGDSLFNNLITSIHYCPS